MRYFLLVISILSMAVMSFGKLLLKHQWKYVEILWESPQQKEEVIKSGRYNASAAFFNDVDKALDGRVFVTVGNDRTMVPASILTVTEKQGEVGPLLRAYPDWSWYKDDCKGITGTVYNIDIKCNHMFIVDNGQYRDEQICDPQLLIFDLSTDKLVKRVTIPIEIAHHRNTHGVLTSVAVLVPHCRNVKDNAVVFMADVEGGLVVYNGRTSKMCRVESDSMKVPLDNIAIVANKSYNFKDGIHGLTIINRNLYYATLMGRKIFEVEIPKLIECSEQDISQANKQIQSIELEGPTAMLGSDRCALYFSDVTKTSIMCADTTKGINSINKELVAYDPQLIEFPSGLKVRYGELLILSNRYQFRVTENLNINEINFRFLSIPITEIEKNTNCYSSCKY